MMPKNATTTFAIKNFGPIKAAEFALKPLTVFVGPNNSGKSYAALLAYTLSRALNGRFDPTQRRYGPRYRARWHQLMFPSPDLKLEPGKRFGDLPEDLQEAVLEQVGRNREFLQGSIIDAFLDYFNTRDLTELIRTGSRAPLEILVESGSEESIRVAIHADPQNSSATLLLPQSETISSYRVEDMDEFPRTIGLSNREMSVRYVSSMVFEQILDSSELLAGVGFYLPSARSGILQGWTILASLALQAVRHRFGLERIEVTPFSGVTGDFLELLLEYAGNSTHRPETDVSLAPALEILEGTILGGEIRVGGREGPSRPELSFVSGKRRLPLQRASSMVAELAPLDLWLKDLVRPGDVLIIDEPEAHLHPENQRHIARVLVRLVRAGVRIICPTHSSLILHQLSNHLLATSAPEATRIELGYTSDDLLTHEDIGVYLFELTDDGSIVSPVPVDSGFGISEDEFVRVSEAIGEESYRLTVATTVP